MAVHSLRDILHNEKLLDIAAAIFILPCLPAVCY